MPVFDVSLVGPYLFSTWYLAFFIVLCHLPLICRLFSFEDVTFTFYFISPFRLLSLKISYLLFSWGFTGNRDKWMCLICLFFLFVFFYNLFIYFSVLGLCYCAWAFSSCGKKELATLYLHCAGFSCCRAWVLGHAGFSSCSSQALEHRL